ncbi:MAG: dihydrolipoamide acetyltransferase family protein [Firmicutes bacterium]|nr:dihydrolipoamide acetyltransferase family protein [Bacillota bacterium]
MNYKVVMPALGETMDEGTIVAWHKRPGDWVDKGDVLMEVMTDKATFEVEAKDSGYLRTILAGVDNVVPVGEVIAWLADTMDEPVDEEEVQSASSHASFRPSEESSQAVLASESRGNLADARALSAIRVSPRARRLLNQHGLSLEEVAQQFSGDILEASDVEAFLRAREERATESGHNVGQQTIKVEGLRKIIADRMTQAAQIPQVTLYADTSVETLMGRHRLLKVRYAEITLSDWIVKAVATILVKRPDVNARYEGTHIESYQSANVGLAVDTPHGLMVPVIHHAETLTLAEIARERRRLIELAQARRLGSGELSMGTFTVSNLGNYGIDRFDPIVNVPEVAILGVGRLKSVVVLKPHGFLVEQQLPLSLTFDHRALDGGPAATFLNEVCRLLAEPPEDWV